MEFFKNLLAMCAVFMLWELLIAYRAYRKSDTEEKKIVKIGKRAKRPNLIELFFYDLPQRIGKDRAELNPNAFRENGLIVFEGEQGSGKTSSMVKMALDMKKEFPKAWLVSNMQEKDAKLVRTPEEFIKLDNGIYGQIVQIDELGVWWNSKGSKYLSSSITQYITTQRKNRRIMLGTIQSFYMLSKDLRCQTKYLISCKCLFSCLNIQIWKKPTFNEAGELEKLKFKKITMFLQDDNLRNTYDTYEVIKTLDKYGMREEKQSD